MLHERAVILLAVILGMGLSANASVVQLTSSSQLSGADTSFSPTTPAGTVYTGPAVAFPVGNDLLIFSRGSGGFEVDQVGATYGSSAFSNGTTLVSAGGFQGPGDGGSITLAFAVPIIQFGVNIEEFTQGYFYDVTFTAYSGTTSLGTFTSNVAYDPTTLAFAGLTTTANTYITSIVFNDCQVAPPQYAGLNPGCTNNLAFGNLEYAPFGITLQASAPEPTSFVLFGFGLLGVFLARRRINRKPLLALIPMALVVTIVQPGQSQILTRGLNSDLTNTADQFISLDINGDGKADMLYFRPGGGYAGAYLSHGDGTFRYVPYVSGGSSENGFPGDLSSPADTFVALDLNGDKKSDFIEYRPGSGYAFQCLSNGDGTVNCLNLSTPGGQSNGFQDTMTNGNERIVPLDLNGDGRIDFIVFTPGGGSAHAYISQANGTLQYINLTSGGTANSSIGWLENMNNTNETFVPLDLNGDGYSDLLVLVPNAPVFRAYLNNKNGTFTAINYSVVGQNAQGFTGNASNTNTRIIPMDLNGDGKSDFLWIEAGAGTVKAFLSNGNGTLTAVNYLVNGQSSNGFVDSDTSTSDRAIAFDLNGDGKSDFLWYSPGDQYVTAYLASSSGNGSVTAKQYRTPSFLSGNFNDGNVSSNDTALPLNFLGQTAYGFVWYVPGSGLFQAYSPLDTVGNLTYYGFVANPATFFSDLSWSLGNVPLKEINMAGTHDSSMHDMIYGYGDDNETQITGYTGQLNAGARAFDFRFGYYYYNAGTIFRIDDTAEVSGQGPIVCDTVPNISSSGFYMFGHTDQCTDYTTVSVLNEIENWLVANPKEIVILDFSGVVNGSIAGVYNDVTSQVVPMLLSTVHPELIYTQQAACGVPVNQSGFTGCKITAALPQNVTPAKLQALNKRLILIDQNGIIDNVGAGNFSGYTWDVNTTDTVGYCGSGNSTVGNQIQCMDVGNNGTNTGITTERPYYQAADSATQFLAIKAVLTPFGAGGLAYAPVEFAIGDSLLGVQGFNNGTDQYDLENVLDRGTWNNNATNLWYLDAIETGTLVNDIIGRNHQKWVNANFFNTVFPQAAGAISAGRNGDVWAAPLAGGHAISIYKYNVALSTWAALISGEPNVKRMAVDASGGVYVVDGTFGAGSNVGNLLHFDQNGANKYFTGSVVQDVAVGGDGSVWAIGENGSLFQVSGPTNGSPSVSVPSQTGIRLAVDNRGYPWVVQQNGTIYRFNGAQWVQMPATAAEISAGADGSVFIVGANSPSVLRYDTTSNSFLQLQMDALHVTTDGTGHPWAIRQSSNAVYTGSLEQ